jgi:hypothetical protein
MVSDNVPAAGRGAPRHGSALLAGILRCRRCGRKLTVQYTGTNGQIPRYACVRGRLDYGEPSCIAFGGLRVDDALEAALPAVVQPAAVQAAEAAEAQASARRNEAREALARDLEAARLTPPTEPSASTTLPIRRTAWSPANWRHGGTERWCAPTTTSSPAFSTATA